MNAERFADAGVLCQQEDGRRIHVEVVTETASTNTDLLARLPFLTSATALWALRQTAGRGRNGRRWYSAEGASLTFSLAWPFSRAVRGLSGLSLAVGVALTETLIAMGVPVMLKWPNDILADGRKLAGILVETRAAGGGDSAQSWAVIGVGLNLGLPEQVRRQLDNPAASAGGLADMDRPVLLAKLLDALADMLGIFDQSGFAPFAGQWRRYDYHHGRKVCVQGEAGQEWLGVVAGVNAEGMLHLETDSGAVFLRSGDVSLRPHKG
ncbi:MAG: biotin--[acetyl-CoA-carboxylase] ligase [Burkholderiaceae bacterium]|jgi:BirA family biotin operon repressor/biotin-[acetyl-CoA-carboxylase] ligase|nr:biotin--[acetyl-CoA-carboxylase] ligase [Burkholderiaceae bacterium]